MIKFLIDYHELLTVLVMAGVLALMFFIRPPAPWKYAWWTLGFFTPLVVAITLQLYFNNVENYPEGLCLLEETDRIKTEERAAALKKLKVQEEILKKHIPPSLRDQEEMKRITEEKRNYLLDEEAEKKNFKDPRLREIKILRQESKKGNSFVALLENNELQWGRDFKLLFKKNVKYKTMDCSKRLQEALRVVR